MAAALVAVLVVACGGGGEDVTVDVVAEGLLNPVGVAVLPDGRVLVAEEGTGEDDDSAGVSVVAGREVNRVVSGLPSGRDSGDLSGVPLVGVSPDGATVYTAHFGSDALLAFPAPTAKAVDAGVVLGPADLRATLTPRNRVRLENPFDVAFAADGTPVVTDASGNGVATANPDGTAHFLHRFGEIAATESLRIDPVPTGIARVGDEYWVTLTGGCPYPEGGGRLVAIDGERGERVVAAGLDMPIDVAVGPDGAVWVLEFARFDPDASCFTGDGYRPGTGKLSRLDDDGEPEEILGGLDFPGSLAFGPDGSLYVSEVFTGRLLRVTIGDQPEAEPVEPARPWRFTEVAAAAGLDFAHGATGVGDPVSSMGGGLCWLDYDGDGWLDLFLVNGHDAPHRGRLPRHALYRNDAGTFADVSDGSGADLAGRGMGCLAVDYDADGDPDLLVTAFGADTLLRNDGLRNDGAAFVAVEAGIGDDDWSSAAVAGDVTGDGLVDVYVANYLDLDRRIDNPSGAFPQDYLGVADRLYVNQGDGTFADEAAARGLSRQDRTLGALLTDYDGDRDLDLYVANDGQPNRLFRNDGAGHFTDVTGEAGVGDSGSGMGVAAGDYDGDGGQDLFVTNWERELHALYRHGPGTAFTYSTFRIGLAGLGEGDTGWGAAWGDLDHDTDLDLVVANGRVPVTDPAADAEPVRLLGSLAAEGRPGELREWTDAAGLGGAWLGRGLATADYDNDGDLDVAVSQLGGPVALFRNEAPPGNSLVVTLDPFVSGTLVTATLPDGTRMIREVRAGGSYLSSEDPRAHFGLGEHAEAEVEVEVHPPAGAGEVSFTTR